MFIYRHIKSTVKLTPMMRIFSIAAVLLISAGSGFTADLWVDRDSLGGYCDDGRSRSAVSKSTPWCTLGVSANNVQPGDVVHVREGVYSQIHYGNSRSWGMSVLQMVTSGTAEQPIVFMAEPGESVVLNGSGGASWGVLVAETQGFKPRFVEIRGFLTRDFNMKGVMVQDTSDVVLEGLEVTSCIEGAIGVIRSARVTVENCRIHHNSLTGWTSPINYFACQEGNVIRGNYVWANTDEDSRETEGHGIILDLCEDWGDALIENNVIWDNEGLCINVFYSNGAVIRNNTCYRNNLGRYEDALGEIWIRGEDCSVHNNIMVSRGLGPALLIADVGGNVSSVTSDYNILWSPATSTVAGWPNWQTGTLAEFQSATQGYGWDVHSMQVDPALTNPGNEIFSLTAASPAIDSGSNGFSSAVDVNGFSRPHDGDLDGTSVADIGAFEFGGSGETIFCGGFETGTLGEWSLVQE